MSYLTTGATAVQQDKTPQDTLDIIKTWHAFKNGLIGQFGAYKYADGTFAMLGSGFPQPMISTTEAENIYAWMTKIGQKSLAKAKALGLSTSSVQTAMNKYASAYSAWKVKWGRNPNSFTDRMPLALTEAFMVATGNYVVELSTAIWSSFNIGTKAEILKEAFYETPGHQILTVPYKAAAAAVEGGANLVSGAFDFFNFATGSFGTILKVAFVGVLAYGGYRVYRVVNRVTGD